MSDDVIISVENLGKKYRISHQQQGGMRYVALRDVIAQKMKTPFQFLRKITRPQTTDHGLAVSSPRTEDFWALKDVSFSVREGEVIGIIGRNGAGKSTLLKILSRITEPTEGRVRIRGRVASLLEVGTGFHPELTGRENIFLNGAILGMHRAEIKRKFDEIVAFAEVEKFLDTPVKRYSSGMYVRLAFAVAAHLEPEILIVDEVLAVGDAEFQKKCLGKMQSVSKQEGRTVLFVSHNMAAISNLCNNCFLLAGGRLVMQGYSRSVIQRYLVETSGAGEVAIENRTDRQGNGKMRFTSVAFCDRYRNPVGALVCGAAGGFILRISTSEKCELRNFHVSMGIDDDFGQRVLLLDTRVCQGELSVIPPETTEIHVALPKVPLLPGRYHLTLYSEVGGVVSDWLRNAASFDVENGDFFGTGRLPPAGQGVFVTEHKFSLVTKRQR